jgi:hypothetical protein
MAFFEEAAWQSPLLSAFITLLVPKAVALAEL